MCFFTELRDPLSHLPTSFLLALVAAIPNHTIRYFALSLIICFGVLCTIHLKSPSTQLRRLGTIIHETDELLRRAMAQCPREYIKLVEQMGRLLEANKTTSLIKCRILTSAGGWFSWTNYRVLSSAIGECAKRVKTIHTTAQLTIEAEHQRKINDDINEMQFILGVSTTSDSAFKYCGYS
ncbi:hypothetical protein K438DRAFT_1749210 [Mycena galopus ATCC 62051]|nr:hypothetical protein K438DRAFT_1749210 [Mycena galopus ATCC 62051]